MMGGSIEVNIAIRILKTTPKQLVTAQWIKRRCAEDASWSSHQSS